MDTAIKLLRAENEFIKAVNSVWVDMGAPERFKDFLMDAALVMMNNINMTPEDELEIEDFDELSKLAVEMFKC